MVEPVVDYSKVDAVNIKKTIAFVNNFAINTTQFLNRFSYICEQKLVWLSPAADPHLALRQAAVGLNFRRTMCRGTSLG